MRLVLTLVLAAVWFAVTFAIGVLAVWCLPPLLLLCPLWGLFCARVGERIWKMTTHGAS